MKCINCKHLTEHAGAVKNYNDIYCKITDKTVLNTELYEEFTCRNYEDRITQTLTEKTNGKEEKIK